MMRDGDSQKMRKRCEACLLLGLEVVEQDAALLALLTPIADDDARAVDNLAGITLAVDLACYKDQSLDPTTMKFRSTYKDQPIRPIACHPAP